MNSESSHSAIDMPQTPVGTGNKYSVIIPSKPDLTSRLLPSPFLPSFELTLSVLFDHSAYNERKNLPVIIWLLVRVFEEK